MENNYFQDRYNTLINLILNNIKKGYINDVEIKDDKAIIEYVKAVEPDKFENVVLAFNKKSELEQHVPTID